METDAKRTNYALVGHLQTLSRLLTATVILNDE